MALTNLVPNPNDNQMQPGAPDPGILAELQRRLLQPPPMMTVPKPEQTPVMPPTLRPIVTSPRQQQEMHLQDILNKPAVGPLTGGFWHKLGQVASRVGQVGAATFIPGAAMAESMIPGSMLYNQERREQAQTDLGTMRQQDIAEKQAVSEQQLRGAQAAEAGAKARAAELVEITPDLAASIGNPALAGESVSQGALQHLLTTNQTVQGRLQVAGMKTFTAADGTIYHVDPKTMQGTAVQDAQGNPIIGTPKPVDIKKQIQNDVAKAMQNGDVDEVGRLTQQLYAIDPVNYQNMLSRREMAGASVSRAATAAGQLDLSKKAFERDTFGTIFGQAIPTSLVDESGNTLGWKSPSKPTSTMMTQAQQSQDLAALSQAVRNEILQAEQSGELGPYQGRINEIMTGKVGADNPQFAHIRALGSMYLTGAMKAHFGARGGQQMFDHFKQLMDTGKMTGGDLIGAMNGFETFFNQYAQRAQTVSGKSKGKDNVAPSEGTEKKNSAGYSVVYKGGKWVLK